jgi:hypothetical protein
MVTIVLELDKEIESEARSRGLLTSENLAQMIKEKLRQQKSQEARASWRALDKDLEPVREAFRAEYGHLSDDEVMDMINDLVHEVRAETAKDRNQP